MALLPESVSYLAAGGLVAFSLFTAALTAAFGIGGGVMLLVVLAQIVPVSAIVPLHGVVQLGANTGRAALQMRNIAPGYLLPFVLGAAAGALVGGLIFTELPDGVILMAVGVFVLITTWVSLPKLGGGQKTWMAGGGFLATLLTMFVGATGPFTVALFGPAGLPHRSMVATVAVAMTTQHFLKTATFVLIGFAFAPWLPLLAAMLLAGFVGTYLGTRLLIKLPEDLLRKGLKVILTVLGIQLTIRGIISLW